MEQFKKSENDAVAFERHKEMQRRSKNNIRSAKRNFEQKLAKDVKNANKSFFAYVRRKQRTVKSWTN